MKRYLFLIVFLLTCRLAFSQDIIVTNEGDTINCQITRVTEDFVHFAVYGKNGVLLMKSRLPVSGIQYYNQTSTSPADTVLQVPKLRDEDRFILQEFRPAKFRLSLNTGYTYQFGGYENLPDSYKKQMQSLWNFGGELDYFFDDNIGIGARYNYVYTKANEDFEPPFSTAFGFSSLRDEKVTFNYMALSVLYRNFIEDDQVMHYFISGGFIHYRTDGLGDGVPFYQEGDTFGVALGISYDFVLVENFGLGLGAEVNIARLSEFDNNGANVLADFSLTRLDLTFGIRVLK